MRYERYCTYRMTVADDLTHLTVELEADLPRAPLTRVLDLSVACALRQASMSEEHRKSGHVWLDWPEGHSIREPVAEAASADRDYVMLEERDA
jgi:hypothetical protein